MIRDGSSVPAQNLSRNSIPENPDVVLIGAQRPQYWRFGFIFLGGFRPLAAVAVFRPEFLEASPFMSLRALLYRRPTEPQAITVVFDKAIYLVRLRRHRRC